MPGSRVRVPPLLLVGQSLRGDWLMSFKRAVPLRARTSQSSPQHSPRDGTLSGGPMPELLVVFDVQLTGTDGRRWSAQACGGIADDGLWEGWIEFLPLDADELPVRTARETEQP